MHDNRKLIEDRLKRVLRERIRPAVYGRGHQLDVAVWHAPGEPVSPRDGIAESYQPARIGEPWGPAWGTSWFRFSGEIPTQWKGEVVEARIDLGFNNYGWGPGFSAEGLAYWPDGRPAKGLHPDNQWLRLASPARGGEDVNFYVEAAANPRISGPVTWLGDTETAGAEPLYQLDRAELAVFNPTVWQLVRDLEVLGELMAELPVDQPRRHEILAAVGSALDVLDITDVVASAEQTRQLLAGVLQSPANASAHRISAVGHAHIDSAWLWPLRETVRKVARTVSNTVDLMDEYPDYVFAMSQAQQLAWIKEYRPEVYQRVKEKVAGGQFVPVGGMWVESDTNMPGSEAMARQFSHGKRFYLDEFGIETEEVWLPDSFGYSAAMPQLVQLSGSRWFLTQKISWSQSNKFPHHTFWWEGIDGTRIFTHFPPVDTYNATFAGKELAHAERNFRDKGAASRSLVPFGHGDGGGGATREMLGRAQRLANLEGSPRVEITTPADFFTKAHNEYPDAPVWVGELYLELHRGTYTSQAKTKRGNRRSEHLLREAELWAATAAVRTNFDYPYEQLDRIWKTVLLHQFHDILPGSSIAWVHRQAAETYRQLADELESIIEGAQHALAGEGAVELVFNAAPHTRDKVPAGGAYVRSGAGHSPVVVTDTDDGWLVDNGQIRVCVDTSGSITSVFDIAAGREAIAPGQLANLLQVHPDLPNHWDAWDIDSFYRNKVTDLLEADEVTLAYAGSAKVAIKVVRRFGASTISQLISLSAGTNRVDFDTEVDWRESETLLKAAFPIDIRAADSAAETQFGHVKRPTHTNTSWQAAQFEICAHRFMHVAEPGWGAAIVNDSVYGHDVSRAVRADAGTTTTVRLSLLRAPRFPDPEADQGVHHFRYAFVPGSSIIDAVQEGYRINLPARRVLGSNTVAPLLSVDNDKVVLESIKLADDASGDIVVRMYEAVGGRASARVVSTEALERVVSTDLLERALPDGEHQVIDNGVVLSLRPFQIMTLRLKLGHS